MPADNFLDNIIQSTTLNSIELASLAEKIGLEIQREMEKTKPKTIEF